MAEVMLVEDDEDLRLATTETLELAGFRIQAHAGADAALAALRADFPGVILSDLRMPGMSGLDFLDHAQKVAPEVPFIMITAHGDVPAAIRAMRGGAHDFLEKPCAPELMLDVLRRAQQMRDLRLENLRLRESRDEARIDARIEDRLIGTSPAMQVLRGQLRALAGVELDLLIAGETGTGKELVARILHDLSPRAGGPFIAINCGALTEAEVDRELFGTGDMPGLISRAEGGTLYLDELDSMPESLQIRLLRVVESREITPLGAAPSPVDLRILACVKQVPDGTEGENRLRADLFHRFSAVLPLPPLRDRDEDAALLVAHFAREAAARHDLPKPHIDSALRGRLAWHDWPGNVREARNLAEKLVIGLEIGFPGPDMADDQPEMGYDAAMGSFEARLLRAALIRTGGRKTEAAALLGIPRKRLYLRLRRHDMLDQG